MEIKYEHDKPQKRGREKGEWKVRKQLVFHDEFEKDFSQRRQEDTKAQWDGMTHELQWLIAELIGQLRSALQTSTMRQHNSL